MSSSASKGSPGAPRRVGLARALSKRGLCSRRAAQALVAAGRVRVDGRVVRDPEAATTAASRLELDGAPLAAVAPVHLALNKPRGLVTTARDEHGRETVYACLRNADLPWLAPVGRLDKASEGLLLFTNDSEWAARLTDPVHGVEKTYHVQIDAVPDAALVRRLCAGVAAADGGRLAARRAAVLRSGERHGWLEVVLDEGRNRHLRRLLEALGHRVLRLVRVRIGSLALGVLGKGEWRRLTAAEAQTLAAGGAARGGRGSRGGECATIGTPRSGGMRETKQEG